MLTRDGAETTDRTLARRDCRALIDMWSYLPNNSVSELSSKVTSANGSAIKQTELPRCGTDDRATGIYQGVQGSPGRLDFFNRCRGGLLRPQVSL
jgi:hypothetical protein